MITIFKLPAQTSYLTVEVILDDSMTNKAAIAIDILRTYFKQEEEKSPINSRAWNINGFSELISFDELLLGTWLVFDELFGYNPKEISSNLLTTVIGWNGEVTYPYYDIPIALKLYDDLKLFANSKLDRDNKIASIQKHFYKNYAIPHRRKFFNGDYNSTDDLERLNPNFYNWILDKCSDINRAADIDWSKINSNDIQYLAESVLQKTRFYSTFLDAIENILYQYTYIRFPIKMYALIGYMFTTYMNVVINFIKPYHASIMPGIYGNSPHLIFGNDSNDSIHMEDDITRHGFKYIMDRVVKYDNCEMDIYGRFIAEYMKFDKNRTKDYDNLTGYLLGENSETDALKIRDFVTRHITSKGFLDIIMTDQRLDQDYNINPHYLPNVNFKHNQLDLDDITNYIHPIYVNSEYDVNLYSYSTFEFEALDPSEWEFWKPLDKGYIPGDVLDWDQKHYTVTNNWDRPIIITTKYPIKLGYNVRIDDIYCHMSEDCKIAFKFDDSTNFDVKVEYSLNDLGTEYDTETEEYFEPLQKYHLRHFDEVKTDGFGDVWAFHNDVWKKIPIPSKLKITNIVRYWKRMTNSDGTKFWLQVNEPDGYDLMDNIIGTINVGTDAGDTLQVFNGFDEDMGTALDHLSTYDMDDDVPITYVRPYILIPVGGSFSQISGYIKNNQEIAHNKYLPHQHINWKKKILTKEVEKIIKGDVQEICFSENKDLNIRIDNTHTIFSKDLKLLNIYDDHKISRIFEMHPYIVTIDEDEKTLRRWKNGNWNGLQSFNEELNVDRISSFLPYYNELYYSYKDYPNRIKKCKIRGLDEHKTYNITLAASLKSFNILGNHKYAGIVQNKIRLYDFMSGRVDQDNYFDKINDVAFYYDDKLNRWIWILKKTGEILITDYWGNTFETKDYIFSYQNSGLNGFNTGRFYKNNKNNIIVDLNDYIDDFMIRDIKWFCVDNSQAIYIVRSINDEYDKIEKFRINI